MNGLAIILVAALTINLLARVDRRERDRRWKRLMEECGVYWED